MQHTSSPSVSDDVGRFLLRIAVGGLMLFHGIHKAMEPKSIEFIRGLLEAQFSKDVAQYLQYGVYVGEIVAPLMLVLGLATRMGAAIMAVNMGFAIWLAHGKDLAELGKHGQWAIELPAFYLLGALALLFLGGGRLGLDHVISGNRH